MVAFLCIFTKKPADFAREGRFLCILYSFSNFFRKISCILTIDKSPEMCYNNNSQGGVGKPLRNIGKHAKAQKFFEKLFKNHLTK